MKLSNRTVVGIAIVGIVLISAVAVAYKVIGSVSADYFSDQNATGLAYANSHYSVGSGYVYKERQSGPMVNTLGIAGLYKTLGRTGNESSKKYDGLPISYGMTTFGNGTYVGVNLTGDFSSFEAVDSSAVTLPENMIVKITLKNGQTSERGFGRFVYYPWNKESSGYLGGNIGIKYTDVAQIELLRKSADNSQIESLITRSVSAPLATLSNFVQFPPQNGLTYGIMSHYALGLDGWVDQSGTDWQTCYQDKYCRKQTIQFLVRQPETASVNKGIYVNYSLVLQTRLSGGTGISFNQLSGDNDLTASDVSLKIEYSNGASETVSLDSFTEQSAARGGRSFMVKKETSRAAKDMAKISVYRKSFDSTGSKPFLVVNRQAFAGESSYRAVNQLIAPYERYGGILAIIKNIASGVKVGTGFVNSGVVGLSANVSSASGQQPQANYKITGTPNGVITQVNISGVIDNSNQEVTNAYLQATYSAMVESKNGAKIEKDLGKFIYGEKSTLHTLAANYAIKFAEVSKVTVYRNFNGKSDLIVEMNALNGTPVTPATTPTATSSASASATASLAPPTATSYNTVIPYREPDMSGSKTCGRSDVKLSLTDTLTSYEKSWLYGQRMAYIMTTSNGKKVRILLSVWQGPAAKYNIKIALGNLSEASLPLKDLRFIVEFLPSGSLLPIPLDDLTLVEGQYNIKKNDITISNPQKVQINLKDMASNKVIGCISPVELTSAVLQ